MVFLPDITNPHIRIIITPLSFKSLPSLLLPGRQGISPNFASGRFRFYARPVAHHPTTVIIVLFPPTKLLSYLTFVQGNGP